MKRFLSALFVVATILVIVSGLSLQAQDTVAQNFVVEVAENPALASIVGSNFFEDGMPGAGNAFITRGYLYPEGTLNGSNGVLENGEPEFPELVVGEWTCYGWLVGEGVYTESGEWVVSTQVYQFNDSYNNATIVTNGFEIVDADVPYARVISGGTGSFAGMAGEQIQTLMGVTEQMGVNLQVEFSFSRS